MAKRRRSRASQTIDDLDHLVDVATKIYNFVNQKVKDVRDRPAPGAPGDPYAILGIEPQVSFQEKKRRYRQLMLIVHSDRGGDDRLASLVNNAWDEICQREGRK